MTRIIMIAVFLALAFLCSPAQAQTEWVDVIVQIPTPKEGASPTLNGVRMINAYPLAVDKGMTTYLYRVSADAVDIRLKPAVTAGKAGEKMWSGEKAWNFWHTEQQALVEKVLVFDAVTTVDGKPVTETVSVEAARATAVDFDVKKVRVPMKFSGTVPAIKPEELKATAVSVEVPK